MYDFIGDIHGHAEKLKKLLDLLGYKMQGGIYQHPERKAFFLGDLIDSGPNITEVLNIVIPMVNKNAASIVIGNHEFNFLSYNTKLKSGEGFLRERTPQRTKQCQETLNQLNNSEIEKLLSFIWQMPLWREESTFQAIHACWDEPLLEYLRPLTNNGKLNTDLLVKCNLKNSNEYNALEVLLKGHEVELPKELHFIDSYEGKRTNARVCWWDEKRKIIIPKNKVDPMLVDLHRDKVDIPKININKPTFFGHYWESKEVPTIVNPKAVCLDYSVAKAGLLCAYRFDGESELSTSKFFSV